jgi:hypothetical protein
MADFISRTLERASDYNIVYNIYTEKWYCITNVGDIYTAGVGQSEGPRFESW